MYVRVHAYNVTLNQYLTSRAYVKQLWIEYYYLLATHVWRKCMSSFFKAAYRTKEIFILKYIDRDKTLSKDLLGINNLVTTTSV